MSKSSIKLAAFAVLLCAVSLHAQITVNSNNTHQTWRWYGADTATRNFDDTNCTTTTTAEFNQAMTYVVDAGMTHGRSEVQQHFHVEGSGGTDTNDNTDPFSINTGGFTYSVTFLRSGTCSITQDFVFGNAKAWHDQMVANNVTPITTMTFITFTVANMPTFWWSPTGAQSTGTGVQETSEAMQAAVDHFFTTEGFCPDYMKINEPDGSSGNGGSGTGGLYAAGTNAGASSWTPGVLNAFLSRMATDTNCSSIKVMGPEDETSADVLADLSNSFASVTNSESNLSYITYHCYPTVNATTEASIYTHAHAESKETAITECFEGSAFTDYGHIQTDQIQGNIIPSIVTGNVSGWDWNGVWQPCYTSSVCSPGGGSSGGGFGIGWYTASTLNGNSPGFALQPGYYVERMLFHQAAVPGNVRVDATVSPADANLSTVAFKRPDGTLVVFISLNEAGKTVTVSGLPNQQFHIHKLDPSMCNNSTGLSSGVAARCTPNDMTNGLLPDVTPSSTITPSGGSVSLVMPSNAVWTLTQDQTVLPIGVSVSPTSATNLINTTTNFTATVTNDAMNAGVTWTLTGANCSGATCGTLSASSSASGVAITYTAPATPPAPSNTVTLKATSVTDVTKSASSTITINASPPPTQYDAYGGDLNQPCSSSSAHWNHFETHNGQIWWCTPVTASNPVNATANRIFLESVGAFVVPSGAITNKYAGSSCTAYQDDMKEFNTSYFFNAVGQLSDSGHAFATGSCTMPYPFFQSLSISQYFGANLHNYAPQAGKDLTFGINGNFGGANSRGIDSFPFHGFMDVFDSNYEPYMESLLAGDTNGQQTYKTSNYFIGNVVDDIDFFWGLGAGADFDTVTVGHQNDHVGYIALVSSPIITFEVAERYGHSAQLFTSAANTTKVAGTPPTTCSITVGAGTGPCSLRDYLAKKYGTIGALNTAWGSSYTTFDSAGTNVAAESPAGCTNSCIGDGVTTTFTMTLAHTPISPKSVTVSVGGTAQGGDCAWFEKVASCFVSATANAPYTCVSTGQCVGSILGPSTATLQNGTIPPWLSSLQITEANNAGSSLPQASYFVRTAFHGCSFPTPSREIGNTYNVDAHPQITVGTNNTTSPPDTPGCATGLDIYVSCRVLSGGAASGCVSAASSVPVETLQASNIAIPSGTWVEPTSGLVAGAALPTPASAIDYGTGAVTLTFGTAPAMSASISFSYTYGGWMWGTGLMDEDGRNVSWMGHNPTCLFQYAGGGAGTAGYACRPGNPAGYGSSGSQCGNPGTAACHADANQTMAADLDAWSAEWSSEYFFNVQKAFKTKLPNALYGGTDTLGAWGIPPNTAILQGASPYLDFYWPNWYSNQPDAATGLLEYNYTVAGLNNSSLPFMNFMTLNAQPDSAMATQTGNAGTYSLTTQSGRGAEYYQIVTDMLTKVPSDGVKHWVGIGWWGSHDFQAANWGLKTDTDNAYNAHDAVAGSTQCLANSALPCGSEPAPGGGAVLPFSDALNCLTCVAKANQLWLTGGPSPPTIQIQMAGASQRSGTAKFE